VRAKTFQFQRTLFFLNVVVTEVLMRVNVLVYIKCFKVLIVQYFSVIYHQDFSNSQLKLESSNLCQHQKILKNRIQEKCPTTLQF